MAGTWTKDGRHLQHASSGLVVTCASGAIGKCVRFGYKPWGAAKGQPLCDYHQGLRAHGDC
jgi:ADYC domain